MSNLAYILLIHTCHLLTIYISVTSSTKLLRSFLSRTQNTRSETLPETHKIGGVCNTTVRPTEGDALHITLPLFSYAPPAHRSMRSDLAPASYSPNTAAHLYLY